MCEPDTQYRFVLYMFPSTEVLKNPFVVKVYETAEKELILRRSAAAASAVAATWQLLSRLNQSVNPDLSQPLCLIV